MEKEFTKRELYEMFRNSNSRSVDKNLQFLENKVAEITSCPDAERSSLKRSLCHFKSRLKKKWLLARYCEEKFLQDNCDWLSTSIKVPIYSLTSSGRPEKNFNELSERSKRRKTRDIRQQSTAPVLTFAASMSHRAAGNPDAADLIKKKVTETPTRAKKFKKKILSAESKTVRKHSPEEALKIFIHADLTRKQYEVIRSANKNIYPCYSLVKEAKKQCYPDEDAIIVTETLAEVKLQSLLDHTTLRLCKYLEEVLKVLNLEERHSLQLIYKWGCDGSQQSQFKQKFQNINESDSNIFQSSCVPLKLLTNTQEKKKIIWQNPTPSSTRFCRPIRIRFIQETSKVIQQEIRYVEEQIKMLKKTEVPVEDGVVKVKHTMLLTMVDGKVCNSATGTTSTMKCYICGLTSKDFNRLDKKFPENPETLKFGLSTLHARIRIFESMLHLSYKIPIKKWQARSAEEKKIVAETKRKIQNGLKSEMGLLVDIPKQGFGTSNDGNTSRRFFSDPETVSRITKIDVKLIERLKVILEAITSGHRIDEKKFQAYADETVKLYIKLYNWHPMTPTMHKILIHGATVIKHAIVSIGQLSEEAAEARNKHFKLYRSLYSRKFSREDCNRDVLNRLLLTSDPFMSSCKQIARKSSKSYSREALELLLPETSEAGSSSKFQNETDKDEFEENRNSEESD